MTINKKKRKDEKYEKDFIYSIRYDIVRFLPQWRKGKRERSSAYYRAGA